jgi:hypothetical protein
MSMDRKEDVVRHFMKLPAVTVIESEKILTLLEQAVNYGFEQGESFGKYGAYIEKQNEKMAEAIIHPENDRVWREKLDNIMTSEDVVPWAQQTVQLLALIAEILLVRKNGG